MYYILTLHILQDHPLGLEEYPLAIVLLATSILNEPFLPTRVRQSGWHNLL